MLISRLNDHADEGALPRSDEHKTYFIFVYILFITFFFLYVMTYHAENSLQLNVISRNFFQKHMIA